ncbi:MAG TPA: hypothetical protein VFC01_17475 [Mycobacterium sp.]|nr:hypothetical protein [Mycobacterium sp.]
MCSPVRPIKLSAAGRSFLADAVRSGTLSATLGALMLFAINLFQLLSLHDYTLTEHSDIAAFPKSALPDAARYLLSDALSGENHLRTHPRSPRSARRSSDR